MGAPLTYPAAALGFRGWKVSWDGWLHPLHVPGPAWSASAHPAGCYRSHRSPSPECDCGWNAFHTIEEAIVEIHSFGRPPRLGAWEGPEEGAEAELCVGAVRGWGEMRVHRDGWRAQRAQPLALLGAGRALEAAAERYGVPLLRSETQLREWARESEHQPVPQRARPAGRARRRARPAPPIADRCDDALWAAAAVVFAALSCWAFSRPTESFTLLETAAVVALVIWAALTLPRLLGSQGLVSWIWSRAAQRSSAREREKLGLPE